MRDELAVAVQLRRMGRGAHCSDFSEDMAGSAPAPWAARGGPRPMKMNADKSNSGLAALFAAALLACAPAYAQEAAPDEHKPVTDASKAGEDDIAKEAENPIGNLTVLPFENYTNAEQGHAEHPANRIFMTTRK